jgi:hypothetical protein
MGKRIFLFIVTNIAIVATLSIVASILGIGGYIGRQGSTSDRWPSSACSGAWVARSSRCRFAMDREARHGASSSTAARATARPIGCIRRLRG